MFLYVANRVSNVAKMCKAEVTTEDAVKGDNPSNGLIGNSLMLQRGIIRTVTGHIQSSPREELREDSPLPCLVEHAGSILAGCQKGRDGRMPFGRLHGKKPLHEVVPFLGEKELAREISTEAMNRMNSRYKFGIWLARRSNSLVGAMNQWTQGIKRDSCILFFLKKMCGAVFIAPKGVR